MCPPFYRRLFMVADQTAGWTTRLVCGSIPARLVLFHGAGGVERPEGFSAEYNCFAETPRQAQDNAFGTVLAFSNFIREQPPKAGCVGPKARPTP